jgi:hypothetical protein
MNKKIIPFLLCVFLTNSKQIAKADFAQSDGFPSALRNNISPEFLVLRRI